MIKMEEYETTKEAYQHLIDVVTTTEMLEMTNSAWLVQTSQRDYYDITIITKKHDIKVSFTFTSLHNSNDKIRREITAELVLTDDHGKIVSQLRNKTFQEIKEKAIEVLSKEEPA